ncbi:MAG: ATP-dependent DNA helicase RecG [Candidatus Latescibacteria bacterium]|nr:ATP-dependent DNA helicase RecG [Candidatus Latescibacterota bacterium]NIM21064.1 ATP-dependent DNA helicase RecG [Candidatus Latescibacterota bacterium]NIM65199.1 ATP-dependent DNA helicase RecG [Candidatus Latescibacterota bacterium]NIO01714.1 ATP-dependent DNA helicase RecG [Candidatus Latescibacterota bacterium]NIO28231.1 ATP-dependent DNA helicase RecG [Candidatus Latescibacterota bacterium]
MRGQTEKRQRSISDYCQYLKGVGPVRAAILRRLGIETVENLLTHFPRKYYDRRNISKIADLRSGEETTFLGQILTVSQRDLRRGRTIVTAAVGDDTGIIQVVWFNQPYIARHVKPGREAVMSGELSYYRGARQVVNPEFELLGDTLGEELLSTGRIVPVYPLTRGLSQRFLRGIISRTLHDYRRLICENLPESIVSSGSYPSRYEALRTLHFPEDRDSYGNALRRIKLEELFYLQLIFSLQRRSRSDKRRNPRIRIGFELEKKFLRALPFELTRAQRRVLDDIHGDLSGDRGMNRLLQGEVGSGKTIVAGAALLAAVEAGYQAAMMVPTEVLAVQHIETLRAPFEAVGVPVALLIGALKSSEKRKLHQSIKAGDIPVVIGTHALIQEMVGFRNLGAVVIDEQHRFGVRQRAALLGGERPPHMLVMTATPIPRTLALTAYADLDLSVIDEMPPGRQRVRTRLVPPEKREAMYSFVHDEIRKKARAYFLYPLIEETEKQDLEAAVSAYESLAEGVFEDIPLGLLHGKKSFEEKRAAMEDFASGNTRLLVTTTVVEVGVHVPEATIMVVHHPERFGLSQLHQLRGRVGRGDDPGYCFLVQNEGMSASSNARLKIFTRLDDGFKIAEEDLKHRGPGEFFGVRQHGVPGFKVANPLVDRDLVEAASQHVKRLLDADPSLKGPDGNRCRDYLKKIVEERIALWTVG